MEKKWGNKLVPIIIILLVLVLAIAIGVYFRIKQNQESSKIANIVTESTPINVEYSETELTGQWEEYKAKIELSDEKISIEGSGVKNSGSEIKITSAGSYYITGTISDCNIVVEASKNDDVQLVLDNCNITSKTTAPINCVECDVLTITVTENSESTISDTGTYTKFTDTEKSEPDGAIFTKTDLVINGSGTLNVNSNYLDGIVSKDTLKIVNVSLNINSEDDAIRGKDFVAINSASITINAGGDGIKSTNDEDESLGYVVIDGGNIKITSVSDGIQAETVLNVSGNAQINITTTAVQSSNTSNNNFMKNGFGTTQNSSTSTDSVSSKGLKAGQEITIESGTIKITSTDDCIHSNGIIIINGGTFELNSGDDGIHADTNLVINDASINITKSYEGIESAYIEINGGTINVIASDDGINVAGGADSSSIMGRVGQNGFSNVADSNRKLVINEGNITVKAVGDGLDSNGSIYMYGGTVVIKGPTSSANAPLDFDGEFIVDGGNLIAYGSSGMIEMPSSNSKQNILVFSTSGNNGDTIVLKDSSGNEVTSFTSENSYQVIIVSNSSIKTGESYNLYVNGTQKAELKVNSTVTSNVTNVNNQGMPGMNRR